VQRIAAQSRAEADRPAVKRAVSAQVTGVHSALQTEAAPRGAVGAGVDDAVLLGHIGSSVRANVSSCNRSPV
jgi:hypothetical protein